MNPDYMELATGESSRKDDGGPAFPCPTGSDGGIFQGGMTLRDYFAAAALQGYLAAQGFGDEEDRARFAYKNADAMLAERSK